MKRFLFTILMLFCLHVVSGQNTKQQEIQTNSRLALSYFNSNEYEKAAPLLLEVYNLSRNSYYFRMYLTSLIELERFDEAEEQVKKEIEKFNRPSPEFLIHQGYVLRARGNIEEGDEKYNEAIEMIPGNKGNYLITANAFLQWREYEWAKNVYLQGRETVPGEEFNYELARSYLYLRDYENMMEEYLNLVRQDETQINRVQSSLASAMRLDVDDSLRDKFRTQVLKRIQNEPEVTGYNRLMIWFLLQERQFSAALRQSVSLDRRTGEEDAQIYRLGLMALNNKEYESAGNAFDYLLEKGEANPFYNQSFVQKIHASYMHFTLENPDDISEADKLAGEFQEGLELLGYSPATLNVMQEYAHLLAFYLDETEKAVSVLERGLEIPRLKSEESGVLKTEMADIYVYAGDPWEAMLLYSQVIDANKKNTLGDEVKLKKAKLGYYMGNFSWAKAQLDVLKASTSKLTANDAMDLSMLIGNNLNLDTTAVPLQMFSRADLLFFRNKDSLALATLDSIAETYTYHSLVDDILFRKSKIEVSRNNYEKAAEYLEQIRTDFAYELLADDALFLQAELYNYQLDRKEEAKILYKEMLTSHPGSVFVDESREKYRELREVFPDETTTPEEEFFMSEETEPDEFD
ncbi:Tetratricopeptide repeat-containing protein [Tangfeifania diversioriginum]|uniref:Tetratricopeptide repeat-containing protein n=1 Tax=Tangfeifania diversioriginum TaxID=1168035 RepID=A0A1M6IJ95_9BACT|nr:tetratricopeptide repeat protein [Tangfeifania diversioriginum]SHJ34477.1 Tetratricopeptide repeat-containing protein [Tangfeifania diversioriginum]